METRDSSRGRPVFSARTVGAESPGEPHRTVHCGLLDTSIPLADCEACTGYVSTDFDAFGGPRVRCRAEDLGEPLQRDAEADAVRVTAIMRRKTTCIAPEADLETAAALLVEGEHEGLVVVDAEHRPIGLISPTELVRDRALARSEGVEDSGGAWTDDPTLRVIVPEAVHVRDVMAPFTFNVREHTSVARAAALMAEEGLHRLPVLDVDGRLVGVVTALDVMRWIGERARLITAR